MSRLSVVVATYRMQREAPRAIQSFLPPLQKCVENVDYEVIVIDNGSPERLDLGEMVNSPKPTVRLVRVSPEEASVSPLCIINESIRRYATGNMVMVCIDGARMASSHLICRTVDVLGRYRHAFTFTASRHLGSKLQKVAIEEGYNQEVEDKLLRSVAWQQDLDNLYAVSVLAGCHHKHTPLLQNESNAFAVSRELWEREGGYNEGFVHSGGGWGNLEIFSRYVGRQSALNVLLFGESTFHQVHRLNVGSREFVEARRAEYLRVTGERYTAPTFAFLADLGADYNRMAAVGKFLLRDAR